MTVSSQISKSGPYDCNGSQVDFPFAFKVFSKNDLIVVLTDIATDIETDLVVDTNYTVSLNADQNNNPGGTISTGTTYPTGQKITIARNVAFTQQVSITNFRPDVFERAFDKLTMLVQQLQEGLSRAVKTKLSSEGSSDDLLNAIDASVSAAVTAAGQAQSYANSAEDNALDAAAAAGDAEAAAQAASTTPVAAPTHAAASKATPVDADEIPLIDSAASFGLKRLTWANLKAALKTYFDSLYALVTTITNDSTFLKNDGIQVSSDWVKGLIGGRRFGITSFSSPYVPASAETLSRPHGLSVVPKSARLIMECVDADAGYAVGERVCPTVQWNGSQISNISFYCDATNVSTTRCGSGYVVAIPTKTTQTTQTPASNKWKYCFEFSY